MSDHNERACTHCGSLLHHEQACPLVEAVMGRNQSETLSMKNSPSSTSAPRISRITVGRLYNLGNYEHVRYELTVEVPEGASAASAIRGVEKVLAGLKPLKNSCIASAADLERKARDIEEMRKMPVAEWERRYGHCTGTPSEVIARYETDLREATEKREAAMTLAQTARQLFDDLGGAEQWKDAKLDWENDDRY